MLSTLAALAILAQPQPKMTRLDQARPATVQKAQFGGNATCFKTGENTQGMTKVCYYDCLGSPVAITISSTSICPLSIKR